MVPATQIQPGDHLPPQPVLHGTRFQHSGFTVGPQDEDVRSDLPVMSGEVLLFDPAGVLRTIPRDSVVAVERREAG